MKYLAGFLSILGTCGALLGTRQFRVKVGLVQGKGY